MMDTVKAGAYADQAQSSRYTGIPYSKLDCQGFVEQVLKDCGVTKPDGSVYNWKGSNSMWRNALKWKGTIEEAKTEFGEIPLGSWAFIVKHDGGERDRGYNDNEGNAAHVGIYCRRNSGEEVRDSTKTNTRDGVGYRSIKGFTHIGLPKMIIYAHTVSDDEQAAAAVSILRNPASDDTEFLQALKSLYKYMKGV